MVLMCDVAVDAVLESLVALAAAANGPRERRFQSEPLRGRFQSTFYSFGLRRSRQLKNQFFAWGLQRVFRFLDPLCLRLRVLLRVADFRIVVGPPFISS